MTPFVYGSTSAGVGTYTYQMGHYSQIANVIFYSITLTWTAHTGTGNLRVGGLAVAAGNNGDYTPPAVYFSNITLLAVGNKIEGTIIPATTTIFLYEVGGAAASAVPMDTAGSLYLSGFYFI
jgi:hypothetical protein